MIREQINNCGAVVAEYTVLEYSQQAE